MAFESLTVVNRVLGTLLKIPPGKGAFHRAAACYIVLMISWFILLSRVDGGWHGGHTFIWNFRISLFDFSVDRNWSSPKAHQHHGITKLSQQFDAMKMMKPIPLDVVRYQFCTAQGFEDSWDSARDPWCNFLRRLQLSSILLLTCCTIGLICMFLGFMACFNYHYIKPRDDHFWWATAYLIMAPLLFTAGAAQYWIHTKDFGSLIDESVNIGFLGTGTFGREFGCCVALAFASWIPAWIMIGFSFRSKVFEDSDEEGLWGVGPDSEGDYGAVHSIECSPSGPLSSGTNSDGAANVEDPESQEGTADQWKSPAQALQAVRESQRWSQRSAEPLAGPSAGTGPATGATTSASSVAGIATTGATDPAQPATASAQSDPAGSASAPPCGLSDDQVDSF